MGWDSGIGARSTFRVSRVRWVEFRGERRCVGRASGPACLVAGLRSWGALAAFAALGYEAVAEAVDGVLHGRSMALEDGELGTWIARLLPVAADVVVVGPEVLERRCLERLSARRLGRWRCLKTCPRFRARLSSRLRLPSIPAYVDDIGAHFAARAARYAATLRFGIGR